MTQAPSLAAPTSVAVRIVYLARLREALELSGETLTLPADGVTVARIVEALRARGGAFARELAPGRAFRVAVNHAVAAPGVVVRSGDEVAFLPPVTGG